MPRIPQGGARDDEQRRDRILWKNKRARCERFARRSSEAIDGFLSGGSQQAAKETPQAPTPKLVVKISAPFRYASDKAVPWNYTSRTVTPEPQAAAEHKPEKSVNDIAGTGGMTRSGRCYAPVTLGVKKGETSTENEEIKIAASKRRIRSRLTSQSLRWRRTNS